VLSEKWHRVCAGPYAGRDVGRCFWKMREAKPLGENGSLFTENFARAKTACVVEKRVEGHA